MHMSKPRPPGNRHASEGTYGAVPFDATARRAAALLAAIERELGDVSFFTREDLLHTNALSHVSTITRYSYVREAVTWLLERSKILAITRTELCLAGRKREYRAPDRLLSEYRNTIQRITRAMTHGGDVASVRDVLDAWQSDPHLSLNGKRVVVRKVLAQLAREGILSETDEPGCYAEARDDD